MNSERLRELLAEFALENPSRPLSEVTVLEFAAWRESNEAWDRVCQAAKSWEETPWRE